jgi:hypothetical protein
MGPLRKKSYAKRDKQHEDEEEHRTQPKTYLGMFLRWTFNQDPQTVILVLILAIIVFLGNYVIKVGIPQHLQSIQDGYQRIAHEHKQEMQEISRNHVEQVKNVTASLEMVRAEDRQIFIQILREVQTGVRKVDAAIDKQDLRDEKADQDKLDLDF